jgi:flagellar motor switch protein FliN/FliY
MDGQGETIDDNALDQASGIEDDDLEAQMAAAMAAETGDNDLEAQMAAAMEDETGDNDLEAQMAAAMKEEEGLGDIISEGLDLSDMEEEEPGVSVSPLQFQQLRPSDEGVEHEGIDRLLDVSLNISVELGRKQMQIKDILGLGPGKIIELDKLAGEPVDLLVNGRLLAKGEVVVVDENFGVRITDLINPKDRIKML